LAFSSATKGFSREVNTLRPLRIFYASDNTPNPWFKGFRSNLWRVNLFQTLAEMGHELVEFDYDLTPVFRNLDPAIPRHAEFIRTSRPRVSDALLAQVRAAHGAKPVDLFFSYFFNACVLPETLDAIRALGIKTVNWYCNAAHQFHLVREIAPHYDWCLVPEKFRLPDYRAVGANPIYCQEAANPAVYKPYAVPRDLPVTFVGQAYGDRPSYIEHLLQQGIDVRVWGHGWRIDPKYRPPTDSPLWRLPQSVTGEPLDDEAMIRTFSRSKINLGFSTCGETHAATGSAQDGGGRIVQVRLRDFEVPMSGGFYMVEEMEELAEFFEPDKEIVFYRSPQDLAEKIRYYLAHEDQRERIRLAGFRRAVGQHTWRHRFAAAFAAMGIA
jgi:spore maturation protein CgeB